ncbi:O-antigen ligase family protein [Psychroserpens sp.]
MKLLRYITLVLILWNIPSYILFFSGDSLGSLTSYASFALLLLYYFLSSKHKPAWPFIIFALLYFIISGLNYDLGSEKQFIISFVKYLIVIVCGGELARNTTLKELIISLLLAASSILIHAAFFADDFGRYSGLFLNPNSAGFICLIGCALSYGFKSDKWRLPSLFFFTFCGMLTFSRTFFLLWVIINIISVFQNSKNFKVMGIGVGSVFILLSVATIFQLNTERLSIVEGIVNDDFNSNLATDDSRVGTWSGYFDSITNAPIFGNGFQSFAGVMGQSAGVHNSYLRIIGEAGIFPFLIFTGIYILMFLRSLKTFKTNGYQTLLVVSLMALLLTTHNFIDSSYIVFISIWLYFKLEEEEEVTTNLTPINAK